MADPYVRALHVQHLSGGGVTMVRYPALATGTVITCSGKTTGAFKYAAADANVKAIVAKNVIASNYKIVGFAPDTPSVLGIFVVKLGNGAAAGGALTHVAAEISYEFITLAGAYAPVMFPPGSMPLVTIDGATDGILGDATSGNVAADDTIGCSVFINTGMAT